MITGNDNANSFLILQDPIYLKMPDIDTGREKDGKENNE
jgi:hypothetical protein